MLKLQTMQRITSLLFILFVFLLYDAIGQIITPLTVRRNGKNAVHTYRIRDTLPANQNIYIDTIIKVKSRDDNELFPDSLGKGLMTPTAWGSEKGGLFFLGIGGSFPQIFTNLPDLIAVAGITLGDARKYIGGILSLNINDVSEVKVPSCNIILNRQISSADAISFGGIHLFRSKLSDSGPSYFFVYSHAVQGIFSKQSGASALHYSIGAGTGRFYQKSPADKLAGHGQYGTAVFTNISYELFHWMNVNLEWSGLNLHAGVSVKPYPHLPYINMAVGDITRYSGDRVRFLISVAYSFILWQQT